MSGPTCIGNVAIAKEAFLQWLIDNPGREFRPVMRPDSTYESWICRCPLASYAREQLGYPDAGWAVDRLYPKSGENEYLQAPEWTWEFVRYVDSAVGHHRCNSEALISFLQNTADKVD
jgi:hypothetical protein